MTKKVLISLDELYHFGNRINNCFNKGKSKLYDINGWDDVLKWFNAQPEAPQWVAVGDRLPEDGQDILFSANDFVERVIFRGNFNKGDELFETYSDKYTVSDVTHWMPIPPLPEVKDGA
jgi:hypothetical protein